MDLRSECYTPALHQIETGLGNGLSSVTLVYVSGMVLLFVLLLLSLLSSSLSSLSSHCRTQPRCCAIVFCISVYLTRH